MKEAFYTFPWEAFVATLILSVIALAMWADRKQAKH